MESRAELEQVLLLQVESRETLGGALARRLFDAIERVLQSPRYSLDAAVLIRQAVRHVSEAASNEWDLIESLPIAGELIRAIEPSTWTRVAVAIDASRSVVSAPPWRPDWLAEPDIVRLDQASAAGSPNGQRASHAEVDADPIFTQVTTYPRYRGRGQQAAVRAALTMPPGDTLIVSLPTGTGKTEIALTLAEGSTGATTVIVVPTTALALDMERRIRATLSRENPKLADVPFAWHAGTKRQDRDTME
ncbi:MAG: DEAD/DEAH box helicase, partial [Actinomycetota bacterium]|nr:DEAD/DEAH box helicase [Actinomycetota bacterium]